MGKTRKLFMTTKVKAKIILHCQQNPSLTLREICEWAFTTQNLPSMPSTAAMSRALRKSIDEKTLKCRPNMKLLQPVTCADFETELVAWIDDCEKYGVQVTYWAIKEYAAKISAAYPKCAKLKFSQGRICKFLSRHNLRTRGVFGEAASIDENLVSSGRTDTQELTRSYSPDDVYNLDETAYFFVQKKRLTIALAVDADGSDKRQLKIIGNARNPRWLVRRGALQNPLDYSGTAKGWMTSPVFYDWLRQFNEEILYLQRRVILLVDNASPHRLNTTFSNVTLGFLPPNTTAYLQPLDAGVISAFKKKIRQRKTTAVLSKLQDLMSKHKPLGTRPSAKERAKIFVFETEVAVKWAEEAWAEVTQTTIKNCWKYADILGDDLDQPALNNESHNSDAASISFMLN
ncbi:hypothetical protein Ae201684P_020337 [Aphanomyces euteiches]|nr:hypothetical protein Ae201684P_020337 [Aphanomyces euteiches]